MNRWDNEKEWRNFVHVLIAIIFVILGFIIGLIINHSITADASNGYGFETIYSKGLIDHTEIIKDKKTGVLYLWKEDSSWKAGGLAVMYDENGNVLTERSNK